MMMMSSARFGRVAAVVLALSGLSREAFQELPRFAPPPRRKTADHYRARAAHNRYTGELLREIRAHGQHRECARRRAQQARRLARLAAA